MMSPERRTEIETSIAGKNGPASTAIRELLSEIDRLTVTTRQRVNRAKFEPPTQEDVAAYFARPGGRFLNGSTARMAAAFMDHYGSNGWMVGRVKMSDWKRAANTWERNASRYNADLFPDKPKATTPTITSRLK